MREKPPFVCMPDECGENTIVLLVWAISVVSATRPLTLLLFLCLDYLTMSNPLTIEENVVLFYTYIYNKYMRERYGRRNIYMVKCFLHALVFKPEASFTFVSPCLVPSFGHFCIDNE